MEKKKNMKKIILFISLFLFTGNLFPQNKIKFGEFTIDEYIEQSMKRWQVPGMSVAIIKDGEIVHLKGYGVREIGKPDKVDENTVFAIASNTKPFTGTLISLFESNGKIKLTDKISDYFKDFKLYDDKYSDIVNIEDVISHRLGIETFHGDFFTWGTNFSSGELINFIRYVKPSFELRNGYGYNNTGFTIAGKILEKESGVKWRDLIKDYFFVPLEMNNSVTENSELEKIDNKAMPHSFDFNMNVVSLPYNNVENLAPAGGIYSSAKDVANWIIMQLNRGKFKGREIFSQSVLDRTLVPANTIKTTAYNPGNPVNRHFLTYGLGWFMQDYRGKLLVEHSGGYDGMVSRTSFMPETGVGLVILTNTDDNNIISTLMNQIYDYYLGADFFNWDSNSYSRAKIYFEDDFLNWNEKLADTSKHLMPSFDMNDLIGTYENTPAGTASIEFKDGKYILNLEMRPKTKGIIKHWHNDTLYCETNDYTFGRCFMPVKVESGKIISINIKADDFIDPLYYEFKRKY